MAHKGRVSGCLDGQSHRRLGRSIKWYAEWSGTLNQQQNTSYKNLVEVQRLIIAYKDNGNFNKR